MAKLRWRRVVAMAVGLVGLDAAVAAPAARHGAAADHRAAVLADLAALNNAMPSSFDVWPDDPCAGEWTFAMPNGAQWTFSIMRFEGLSIVHMYLDADTQANWPTTRLADHSLRVAGPGISFTMTCLPGDASVDVAVSEGAGVHHFVAPMTRKTN